MTGMRALFVTASALAFAAVSAQEADDLQDRPPTITVTGTGRVMVAPDQAVVRLGAVIQREEAAAAQERLNAVMQEAIQAIANLDGIEAADIQTSTLSLTPVYTDSDRPVRSGAEAEPRVAAYRASNVVSVVADDIGLVGAVIDAGVAAGVNEIRGISFGLQNDLPQRLDALRRALEEAQQKARAMADALDVTLVEPLEVWEQGAAVPYAEADVGFARAQLLTATPIQPGELVVEAAVSVRYRIDTSESGD